MRCFPARAALVLLAGCGAAHSSATGAPPVAAVPPDVYEAATAPIEPAELADLAILGATAVGGRVVPYGSSGGPHAMSLTERSADPTYGYTEENPIRVGGMSEIGEITFLTALWGPEGQPLYWGRIGSCCPSPAGFGMLDVFALEWDGLETPIVLYVDVYREEPARVPVGLTSPASR